ncbi:MAG: co-chaperone GroES [Candidatus Diapherotrites archaeon]
MKVVPVGERVLVKVLEAEEKTAGGIYLPESEKGKSHKGVVEAVGNLKDVKLDVGDVVFFESYAGSDLNVEGKKYKLLNVKDVLAKVERE